MKEKLSVVVAEDDFAVGLAFHEVPASLLMGFAERVAAPFYRGDIAMQLKF